MPYAVILDFLIQRRFNNTYLYSMYSILRLKKLSNNPYYFLALNDFLSHSGREIYRKKPLKKTFT